MSSNVIHHLYLDYHRWLYRWLHGKLGHESDAADIAQHRFSHDEYAECLRILNRLTTLKINQPTPANSPYAQRIHAWGAPLANPSKTLRHA